MEFPVYLHVFGHTLHPHLAFESLGYFAGARIYFLQRRKAIRPNLSVETNLWLLVGCVFGAWAGSKILAWIESPQFYRQALRSDPMALLGGKTIVGGLLGGWAGVELAKKRLGISQSTGDRFVTPLAIGTAIGRLGCFFTGLDDRTYGIASDLPWAVDFGDGIARHPTQLYESAFVLALAAALHFCLGGHTRRSGIRFRSYLTGYFLFRFFVEFIKPREIALFDLSAIQLASLVGTFLALLSLRRLGKTADIEPSTQ